jgi:hypothetical protein
MLNLVLRLRETRQRLRPATAPADSADSLKSQIELRRVALRDIGLLRTRFGNLLGKVLRKRSAKGSRSEHVWCGKRRFPATRARAKPSAGQNGRRLVI